MSEFTEQPQHAPQFGIAAEFEAALLLEQELIAQGASDAEVFLARQDRMAKEQVATGSFTPIEAPTVSIASQISEPPATEISEMNKPHLHKTSIQNTNLPDVQAFHESENQDTLPVKYRAAAGAAAILSGIVSREEEQVTHGIPTLIHPNELQIKSDDYEQAIRDALIGARDIIDIPKPTTPHMRAKAKQALASIAGDTDKGLKTQEWTERFFELQVNLMS